MRVITHTAQPVLRDALAYVRDTWPYWKRKGGADHLMVMTQDQGTRFLLSEVPEASPLRNVPWSEPR